LPLSLLHPAQLAGLRPALPLLRPAFLAGLAGSARWVSGRCRTLLDR
jgi:hypothetical protein